MEEKIIIKDKNIIKKHKKEILNFVKKNENKDVFLKNPMGENRKFFSTQLCSSDFSKNLKEIRKEIFNELKILNFYEEPEFGIFIGINYNGGNVHHHKDFSPPEFYHLRVNFLLSKPIFGGNPIINNEIINIEEDQGWFNLASEWDHGSIKAEGDKPRIIISLGALIPKNNSSINFLI